MCRGVDCRPNTTRCKVQAPLNNCMEKVERHGCVDGCYQEQFASGDHHRFAICPCLEELLPYIRVSCDRLSDARGAIPTPSRSPSHQ